MTKDGGANWTDSDGGRRRAGVRRLDRGQPRADAHVISDVTMPSSRPRTVVHAEAVDWSFSPTWSSDRRRGRATERRVRRDSRVRRRVPRRGDLIPGPLWVSSIETSKFEDGSRLPDARRAPLATTTAPYVFVSTTSARPGPRLTMAPRSTFPAVRPAVSARTSRTRTCSTSAPSSVSTSRSTAA